MQEACWKARRPPISIKSHPSAAITIKSEQLNKTKQERVRIEYGIQKGFEWFGLAVLEVRPGSVLGRIAAVREGDVVGVLSVNPKPLKPPVNSIFANPLRTGGP